MRTVGAVTAAVVILVSGVGMGVAQAGGDASSGKASFQQYCASCHGASGKGDGPAAFALFPKPRDLASGKFKIRSTPTLPTDEDLFGVISRGMPGTGMPSWAAALSEVARWDLVAFVKTLSPVFQEAGPIVPSGLPKVPPPTPQLISLGKQLYHDAGCVECHGETGRGDGPAAATLKDDWGDRIIPYDFTMPGRMKRGKAVGDVYETLVNGMGGTPMPSFADSLSEDEMWGVAYYVLTLGK